MSLHPGPSFRNLEPCHIRTYLGLELLAVHPRCSLRDNAAIYPNLVRDFIYPFKLTAKTRK